MQSSTVSRARPAGLSAVERAYSHVANAIISGDLAASVLITEGDVAETLGLSRTPVREAFLSLQSARSEEHTSELQSRASISYAVFCLKKKI